MAQGYVALVLHAHLPFVRHPEHEDFLEEDWLYEAITETYIPLLWVLDGWVRDRVPFRLTLSLTPTLCAMLRDGLLQQRYVRHLGRLIELVEKELRRTRWDTALQDVVRFYQQRLEQVRTAYCETYRGDLVGAFRRLQDEGRVEIIACAATHGFLPMMQDQPGAVRGQIMVGRDDYRECFGRNPVGIWLPECAYVPALDPYLQEADLRWFILDAHGVLFAQPRPRYGNYAPIYTPAGVAAFGRDMESSRQVWSAQEGYPGDADYRDFYRDIGFELDLDYLRPYLHADGIRCFTGLKYYRVTGPGREKQLYNRARALAKAAEHARHFLDRRHYQVMQLRHILGREPIVVAPYDAELFGHWWFEGPEFLDQVVRQSAAQSAFEWITPTEYLRRHPTQQIAQPCASSWGNKGYWEVWLDGSNAWIYPHLHVAAQRMSELARLPQPTNPLTERALRQAARELLLAQSSDWAFIMKTGTAVGYAIKRTKDHLLRFNRLYDQIRSGQIDESWLATVEAADNIFPHINWRYFAA